MANQFKVYTSQDVSAPTLMGLSGSLLNVLDACLITGYGSLTSAGWLKPIPNDTFRGCYRQPSGSGMTLFVNDAAPSGSTTTGLTREAWMVGYQVLIGLTGSLNGVGTGQFPVQGQTLLAASASLIIKKSSTANSSSRNWVLFADDRTFYIFIANGDTSNVYGGAGFGDIYSLAGSSDNKKCMIWGRPAPFATTVQGSDTSDIIVSNDATSTLDPSMFICNSAAGRGTPINLNKVGDMGKQVPINRSLTNGTTFCGYMGGVIPTSNPTDNALYMSPIFVAEGGLSSLRGRLRGMFMLLHPIASFYDGQTFSGANEYAGKTFQIVKQGAIGGMWVIETSNTLETN